MKLRQAFCNNKIFIAISSFYKNHATLIGLLYVLFAISWILAPILNKALPLGPNLISEYESAGQPYSGFFRLFDTLSIFILLGGIISFYKNLKNYFEKYYWLLMSIPILMVIDAAIPLDCNVINSVCVPAKDLYLYLHGTESIVLGIVIFYLTTYFAIKKKLLIWAPIVLALTWAIGAAVDALFLNKVYSSPYPAACRVGPLAEGSLKETLGFFQI